MGRRQAGSYGSAGCLGGGRDARGPLGPRNTAAGIMTSEMPIPAITEAEVATPAGEATRATGDTGAATAETHPLERPPVWPLQVLERKYYKIWGCQSGNEAPYKGPGTYK